MDNIEYGSIRDAAMNEEFIKDIIFFRITFPGAQGEPGGLYAGCIGNKWFRGNFIYEDIDIDWLLNRIRLENRFEIINIASRHSLYVDKEFLNDYMNLFDQEKNFISNWFPKAKLLLEKTC